MLKPINYDKITVKYKIYKEACACCDREFDELRYVRDGEWDSSIAEIFDWFDWTDLDSVFEEEIQEGVWEHFYNAIHFYACGGYEEVELTNADVAHAVDAIKKEIQLLTEKEKNNAPSI